MIAFLPFALSLGAFLSCGAVACAWLFRLTSAPLALKIALPSVMLACALYAPISAERMLGYPVPATMADLPQEGDLIAFVPHDAAGSVDVWMRAGAVPRAYEITPDSEMKKTLRKAGEALAQGRDAHLRKREGGGRRPGASPTDITGDANAPYELADDAFSRLPDKE